MSRGFCEFRYWSPTYGGEVVRLSMSDGRGGEYYAIVDAYPKGFTDRRAHALDTLEEAARLGLEPGEVKEISQ